MPNLHYSICNFADIPEEVPIGDENLDTFSSFSVIITYNIHKERTLHETVLFYNIEAAFYIQEYSYAYILLNLLRTMAWVKK